VAPRGLLRPVLESLALVVLRAISDVGSTREAQRVDKVLQDAAIKLGSVASETLGVSSRAMIEALIAGERDPQVLAELAKGRLRVKMPDLVRALHGRFGEHHAMLLRLHLDHIDHLDAAIAALDERVEQVMDPFATSVLELLVTIPGVGRRVAEVIIAEIGVDMSVFASDAHLASWAAVCRATTPRPASTTRGPLARATCGCWMR